MSTSAIRNRRYRDRIKRGVIVAIAEVPCDDVQTLIAAGVLPNNARDDAKEVGSALVALLRKVRDASH